MSDERIQFSRGAALGEAVSEFPSLAKEGSLVSPSHFHFDNKPDNHASQGLRPGLSSCAASRLKWMLCYAWLWLLPLSVFGAQQDARQIVEETQRRTRSDSQQYEGTLQVIDAKNKITEKRWAYDRLGSHGSSKAVLRFTAPAEVKGVALLIINHPDSASDQWMWTPAINRERKIAFQDRATRFFGTDFSFEDLEERDTNQFEYRLLGEEPFDGAACWKIESRPRQTKKSQYTQSYLWIRKDNYALAQIENYNKEQLIRRARYSDIRNVNGIWTAHRIEMHDLKRNSRTILKIEKLQYNVPMKDDAFTVQALRRES